MALEFIAYTRRSVCWGYLHCLPSFWPILSDFYSNSKFQINDPVLAPPPDQKLWKETRQSEPAHLKRNDIHFCRVKGTNRNSLFAFVGLVKLTWLPLNGSSTDVVLCKKRQFFQEWPTEPVQMQVYIPWITTSHNSVKSDAVVWCSLTGIALHKDTFCLSLLWMQQAPVSRDGFADTTMLPLWDWGTVKQKLNDEGF